MAVIGGGPAGLMAAEILSAAGPALSVQVFDAMPSVGRKFLLAGKGGLNLTHSELPELRLQMQVYRDAVQAVYPAQTVKAAFLTAQGQLLEVV